MADTGRSSDDSWYGIATGTALEQGDFLDACPVLVPPSNLDLRVFDADSTAEITVGWKRYDVVVMTQSCDLEHDKVDTVAICPHWSLDQLEAVNSYLRGSRGKEELRRGYLAGYHMLEACDLPGMERGVRVVDFRLVSSLPLNFLQRIAAERGPRLRLRSPYREHLSQAFGRLFSRVALPADIPPFKR